MAKGGPRPPDQSSPKPVPNSLNCGNLTFLDLSKACPRPPPRIVKRVQRVHFMYLDPIPVFPTAPEAGRSAVFEARPNLSRPSSFLLSIYISSGLLST